MNKDAVMFIKGYYKCAVEDEEFITERRNGGDILIWAVDSEARQFRSTWELDTTSPGKPAPDKTMVFLKNRNAIFKKLVKIHNYILPVNEKHTDFEHLWTWSCIRKPGVCLVSQASGIIEHDQNQEASHCQDYWNLRLGQLVLWHFPRTWAKLAQSLPYREKTLSTFKTGLQFLICKAYFQNHAPETLPDGLGQLNCTKDLIEKKRLNSCACPHVLAPTNFLVQSELWWPVRPFCSPLEFIISWDLRCSVPKIGTKIFACVGGRISKHCPFSGFAYGEHFCCMLKWQVALCLPSRPHSLYRVPQSVTEISIPLSALQTT